MKKNITINMFGTLFAIDEDAYELLQQYVDNMKHYFSRREGGDEIADDIERRVAELFSELKAGGHEAITIEDVQSIIRRIGNPEDMGDADTVGAAAGATSDEASADAGTADAGEKATGWGQKARAWMARRRLFRDPQNGVVGGVIAGLCRYFGLNDPLPWRLLFVVLSIFSLFSFILVYLALWAFIPCAVTAEDRLRMQGKPVNPDTLNEEIMHQADAGTTSSAATTGAAGFFNGLVRFIGLCAVGFVIFVFGSFGLIMFIMLGFLVYASIAGIPELAAQDIVDHSVLRFVEVVPAIHADLWLLILSALVFAGLPLFALIRLLVRRGARRHMGRGTTVTLLVVWILSTALMVLSLFLLAIHSQKASYRIDLMENTIDGIYLEPEDRTSLYDLGWKLLQKTNCDENYVARQIAFPTVGDTAAEATAFCFYRDDDDRPMLVQMERAENVPAGNYHLEAVAYACGRGAYLYARPVGAGMQQTPVAPLDDDRLGSLPRTDFATASAMSSIFGDTLTAGCYRDVCRQLGEWNLERTATFHHNGGPLRFGVACAAVNGLPPVDMVDELGIVRLKLVPDPSPSATVAPASATSVRAGRQAVRAMGRHVGH